MTDRTFRLHQLDFADRSIGTVLGTLVLGALVVGLAAPRTFAASFGLLPLAFLIAIRGVQRSEHGAAAAGIVSWVRATRERQLLVSSAAAFVGWSAASALWSVAPLLSLTKSLVAGLIIAGVIVVMERAAACRDGDASRLGEGVWMGVLVGALFVLVEALTDRVLMRAVVNTLHIKPESLKPQMFFYWQNGRLFLVAVDELNRQMVALALFAGAALLAARATLRRPWAGVAAAVIFGAVAIAIANSGSETAKLALVVGAATFAIAMLSRKVAFGLLVAGWLSATLLIVPALQVVHGAGVDASPVLAKALERGSARARFDILNAFVARIGEAPIIGHGANAAYVLGPQEIDDMAGKAAAPAKAPLAQHPHNAYLQIWFDLGAVGALLFAGFGLAILGCLRRLRPDEQPFAFATFASAAAILAPSYGLWQFWYMTMFAVGAIAIGLAIRANRALGSAA